VQKDYKRYQLGLLQAAAKIRIINEFQVNDTKHYGFSELSDPTIVFSTRNRGVYLEVLLKLSETRDAVKQVNIIY